ncbi:MAG: HAMP domain-containing histidine kinase [Oscillospiraceae bacterium]|jgi:signal transduction histidine kinase|nr:HAMP domain-containing histidine kinase [Oscillospiraceae bacterium]MCI8758395.1 HAMP domain-containing histidine kinase [Oscillospiraceae bacterium]
MSEKQFDNNQELERVLGQVSNQLRGSLGNIYQALNRIAPMEVREGNGAVDRDAAVLCQSYYRILRLANNLSDAAHLEGPSAAQLRNGDIVGLCRDIMDRARHPAELLGIRLDFQCEKERHTIAMDKDRIERMMLNLLSNAFKFIRRDEKLVTLDVRVSREWVELILTDTGCGISQELLETVFDRYRHTQRLDPPPHGLGLGLPVCRRIAQEHGGVLLLTSQEGTGTTVTVSLPNKRSKLQQMNTFLVDLGGGYNRTLAELSDALPSRAFTHQYMD